MKNIFLLLLTLSLFAFSCGDDEFDQQVNCDQVTEISAELYENAPNDNLTINAIEVEGDCLNINFSAGGCDGSTWKIELYDSGDILESNRPQRRLRLSLEDLEECEAYITRNVSFDIKNLQLADANSINLGFTRFDALITYEY